MTEAGALSGTLTRVGPPETVEVWLGVGIPNSGAGCNLARSIVTAASTSPQITIDADSGDYCVRAFDIGNLTGEVSFSVDVLHP